MSNTEHIETLRKFFRVSNAAFDFAELVSSNFGAGYIPHPMHDLHRSALIEIEKDNPDMTIIELLLAKMELAAESKPEPKHFERGGVFIRNASDNAIINPTDFS